eukprot:m51a1_g11250 hypothetical protein (318) ;mRNA; r:37981-40539
MMQGTLGRSDLVLCGVMGIASVVAAAETIREELSLLVFGVLAVGTTKLGAHGVLARGLRASIHCRSSTLRVVSVMLPPCDELLATETTGTPTADPQPPCRYTARGGSSYDLSPARRTILEGYYARAGATFDDSGGTYYVNPCGTVDYAGCRPATAACFKDMLGLYYSMGDIATYAYRDHSPPDRGVVIEMTHGAKSCAYKPDEPPITIDCDPHGSETVFASLADVDCHFYVNMTSPYACPRKAKAGLSVPSILLIVMLCLVVVYLVGGGVYNYRYREARGADVIPNREMWVGLAVLVKDGALFIVSSIKKRAGYEAV